MTRGRVVLAAIAMALVAGAGGSSVADGEAGLGIAGAAFEGPQGEPRIGDLSSVRVSGGGGSAPVVDAPTFRIEGPAPKASAAPASSSTTTTTTSTEPTRTNTKIDGSGSFSSSQGGATGSRRSGREPSSSSGDGGRSTPDPRSICSMPAMC